jgi:phosphatidylserine/phosphatidylglycerophosphate/cardiolipin synthase-like enzyme
MILRSTPSSARSRRAFGVAALLALAAACRPSPNHPGDSPSSPSATITLVESVPLETTLDHASVPNAPEIWPAMIDGAEHTIDFAEFYASDVPEGDHASQSRLGPVVSAIERAIARGVRVRFLADAVFAPKYPETLARLSRAGAIVRILDVAKTSGGILHAKYFVVDGRDTFLGSQNFDWRSLDHIFEMGVRVGSRRFAGAVSDVFETDWALAGGAAPSSRVTTHGAVDDAVTTSGERLSFVASPRGWLPSEGSWDLPRMVGMIDSATRSVRVEVLTYKTKDRAGEPFTTLDDALRRAAARGIDVRLLVSDWSAKPGSDAREALEALAQLHHADVRVITIPKWSGGDVPFARVAHAKYMTVDGTRAWVGTSNWEGDYFTKSRNVGVIVDAGALPRSLELVFDSAWTSAYTKPLAATGVSEPKPDAGAAPPSSSGPARP